MPVDLPPLTRRRKPRRAIIAGVALAVLPALLAAAPVPYDVPSPAPTPQAVASAPAPNRAAGGALTAAPPGTTLMIIRHGEKPPKKSNGGIDLNGKPDGHSLTQSGWTRAVYLVDLFAPMHGQNRPGLPQPRHIYAAGTTDEGTGQRTRQTVGPLAAELGIPVITKYGKGNESALVGEAAKQPGPTLICWQHSEIPAIAAALGNVTPAAPRSWPGDRYDVVWSFTATGNGWQFKEIPEMLLPGDKPGSVG